MEHRQVYLTEMLMKELEVNPDKSLQGGLRAARRAVRLLNKLGRSTQVVLFCHFFPFFIYYRLNVSISITIS